MLPCTKLCTQEGFGSEGSHAARQRRFTQTRPDFEGGVPKAAVQERDVVREITLNNWGHNINSAHRIFAPAVAGQSAEAAWRGRAARLHPRLAALPETFLQEAGKATSQFRVHRCQHIGRQMR